MCDRMVFCDVLCKIFLSWCPYYKELLLFDTVKYPEIAHINCVVFLFFERVICDSTGSFVVSVNWCWGLGAAKIFQVRLIVISVCAFR